jgi:hypothetical protein
MALSLLNFKKNCYNNIDRRIHFALRVEIMPFVMMVETAGGQTPPAMFRALAGITKG